MSAINYLKDPRILILILIVVGLALLDVHYGIHFGIDFSGGTQIPIALETGVNSSTMQSLISDLSQRVSTFGLKQVTVEGIGDSEVYVIIPTISQSDVNSTLNIIQSQGKFLGVVNGKVAVNGTDILKGSVGSITPQQENNTVLWDVQFFITQPSEATFAKAVFGQAGQPIYMFLDRPTDTVILINQSILSNSSLGLSATGALGAMQGALALQSTPVPVLSVSNSNSSIVSTEKFFQSNKGYKTALVSMNLNPSLITALKAMNVTVKLESRANMTPSYTQLGINRTILDTWPLVGLLSSPILNASLTNGTVGQEYLISGASPTTLSRTAQYAFANNQEKVITSILNGGALPVAVIPGTPTTVPPTLGKQALYVSGIAGILSILAISFFITIRYRKPFLVLPILLTTFTELFIIVSIIGLVGSIDLAAVAGMIAVLGTGVDSQIIITDEVLSHEKEHATAKGVLSRAFYIIWADAALLILAMMPLFFSTSLVTVIGFSESTIIGALLGVLVTRPAYGALLGRHYA